MSEQTEMAGMGLTPEQLVEHDILDQGSDKWPPLLAAMLAVVEKALVESGVPKAEVTDQAIAVVLAIGGFVGGRLVYIPRGDRLHVALRHAKAWRMWRGNNIEEVAAFLEMSEVKAYAVISKQRKLHKGKIQGSLPFTES